VRYQMNSSTTTDESERMAESDQQHTTLSIPGGSP
jgi:hypothetical protein